MTLRPVPKRRLRDRQLQVAEFQALKAEQLHRIGARDNMTYATLVAIFAASAGAWQADIPELLLALPFVCAVLGQLALANDRKIVGIRRYVALEIAPEATRDAGRPVLRWETGHPVDPLTRLARWAQVVGDLLTFVAPSLVAVAAWGGLADAHHPLAIAVAAAGTLLALAVGAYIVANAHLRERRSGRRPAAASSGRNP